MVRESITTGFCFSSTVKEPTGVGCLGLPIEAGMVRATAPSMLTVKVCLEMEATPSTAAPVSKFSGTAPTDPLIWECAGQNSVGTNCTV